MRADFCLFVKFGYFVKAQASNGLKTILINFSILSFFSSFHQISRSTYILGIQASDNSITVHVPENVTGDVSGNKNLASNFLQLRHCKALHLKKII